MGREGTGGCFAARGWKGEGRREMEGGMGGGKGRGRIGKGSAITGTNRYC